MKQRIRVSRIRATKNLVDGMLAADPSPKALVSGAAVGYYGLENGDRILDEDSAAGSDFLAQVVVDWEAAATEAAKGGVRVATVRTGLILEPESGLLKQLLPVFKLGGGGPLAGGEQFMPWIHIDDEVGLILWALDTEGISGPINLAAPNPVTNRTFSKVLGKVLKRPAVFPAPKFAVTALRGGEVAEFVTASLRVVPRRPLDKGYTFRHPDLEPALRDLLGPLDAPPAPSLLGQERVHLADRLPEAFGHAHLDHLLHRVSRRANVECIVIRVPPSCSVSSIAMSWSRISSLGFPSRRRSRP